MSNPERQIEVNRALGTLRKSQERTGKRGTRIHFEAMERRVAMIKALETGPCRQCQNLNIGYRQQGKRRLVVLRCRAGESPTRLHMIYTTELGTIPNCPSSNLG